MKKTARENLARQVRWERFLRGWSQETLAEMSGMHRTYISALERGRLNPGLDALERLAAAFTVPLAALLGESAAASSADLPTGPSANPGPGGAR